MKKVMLGALLGLSIMCAPSYAADITWNGDIAAKYEKDTMEQADSVQGLMYTLRLNGEAGLAKNFSVYGRISAQFATQPELSDYNLDAYAENRKSVMAFDMFGFKYKAKNFQYKLGRQDLVMGTTALLYSRSDTNIGKRNFVDGLTFTGTTGKTAWTGALVQEDNEGSQDNQLAAIHAGYDISDKWNAGITFGRYIYKDSDAQNTNHWAVDGTYKIGKETLTAELAKSNGDGNNKAYAVTWNHDFNDKVSTYVTAFRVEPNADMGGQSDFDTNNHGFKYGVAYKITKADTATIDYTNQNTIRDADDIEGGTHNTKLEIRIAHSF